MRQPSRTELDAQQNIYFKRTAFADASGHRASQNTMLMSSATADFALCISFLYPKKQRREQKTQPENAVQFSHTTGPGTTEKCALVEDVSDVGKKYWRMECVSSAPLIYQDLHTPCFHNPTEPVLAFHCRFFPDEVRVLFLHNQQLWWFLLIYWSRFHLGVHSKPQWMPGIKAHTSPI